MLFMIIETFDPQDAAAIYRRFRDQGRGAPEGLTFVDSWVDAGLGRVWQVMETDDPGLIQEWVANWADLVDVEVVPVTKSAATLKALESRL